MRALGQWQPNYLKWWRDMGPEGFQEKDVWLRAAICVDADGRVHFDHVEDALYDLRNLFQVNVEEGRHLWAMVYLLQSYFGRDGREEAEGLLERRSGDPDKPRILGDEPKLTRALVPAPPQSSGTRVAEPLSRQGLRE